MIFPKGRVLTALAVFVAAFCLFNAAPAFAADRPSIIKKAAKEGDEKKSSVDFTFTEPSDSKAVTLLGLGYQYQFRKNLGLRLELGYGSKSGVTAMPFFIGGRYELHKGKKYLLFGDGGLDFAMVSYKTQAASTPGIAVGAGAEYFINNNVFLTGGLRLHTAPVKIDYIVVTPPSTTSTPITSSITIALGVGMKF
jgi:opacity protein-like surface antigen